MMYKFELSPAAIEMMDKHFPGMQEVSYRWELGRNPAEPTKWYVNNIQVEEAEYERVKALFDKVMGL